VREIGYTLLQYILKYILHYIKVASLISELNFGHRSAISIYFSIQAIRIVKEGVTI
jgi:hypothetical protein